MARPVWLTKLFRWAYPTRRVFARLTQVPLVGRFADAALFSGGDVVYLPPDRAIAVNEAIAEPESVALPSNVVAHFIEQSSHRFIMHECICRAGAQCQDYPVDLGCLFLGEAVLRINPKLGRLVSKEEALAHVRRARAAGLVHMIGRNRMDSVWLGASPAERLLTICHCCPCCCLWGTIPHLHPQIADRVRRMPGVEVVVTERCVGCGRCARDVCFVDAIRLRDGRAVIDDAACRGCGRCVEVCPHDAIALRMAEDSAIALVEHLGALVDVARDGQGHTG
ncbi:MAG: 4Fe-4S binding protein [Chloroflexota bacterium]